MRSFYYRAYNEAGQKRTGIIEAAHRDEADEALRASGLRPYFLHDYHKLKRVLREKQQKRRQMIATVGTAAVALTLVFSGLMVRYAGRERAPNIEEYKRLGFVAGSSELIGGKTEEEREFASRMYDVWQSFSPGTVSGMEVSKVLMTVYVTKNVGDLSENDLEVLASKTLRALHRQFGASGCTLLVVKGDLTILEVNYNSVTRATRVRSYH